MQIKKPSRGDKLITAWTLAYQRGDMDGVRPNDASILQRQATRRYARRRSAPRRVAIRRKRGLRDRPSDPPSGDEHAKKVLLWRWRTRSTRVTPIRGLCLAPNVHRYVPAPMYGLFFLNFASSSFPAGRKTSDNRLGVVKFHSFRLAGNFRL